MAFWLSVTGWRFCVPGMLLLASIIYLLAIGDRSWFVGVAGTVFIFAVILALTIYIVHYRSAMKRFRQMRKPEGTFEPGQDMFRMTSDVGSTELSWKTVTEVWRFPDFWLLFFSRSQFVTLPTAALSGEACEFILDRIESHGGKVKGKAPSLN
jgi:hypothetical protein